MDLLAEHEADANVIRFGGYIRNTSGLTPQFSVMGRNEIETYMADMGFGDEDESSIE